MPEELVERLFAEFKQDRARWEEFASREASFLRDGREEPPGRAAIVHDFVQEKLGPDYEYWDFDVILKVREDIYCSGLTTTQRALYRASRALGSHDWVSRLTLPMRVLAQIPWRLIPQILRAIWRSRRRFGSGGGGRTAPLGGPIAIRKIGERSDAVRQTAEDKPAHDH
jgi:hypothetical protein